VEIPVERHDTGATHGAGCTHSAIFTAGLAKRQTLEQAAREAARVASEAVRYGLAGIGAGDGPVDVFHLRGAA
jgi:hydroxymethylpyrimidine/phosphomethylpyrimidine kinase